MANGGALTLTTEATQRSLEERLGAALLPHRDPSRPRDHYAATDTFNAATSRHLAAVEAVLVPRLLRAGPEGEELAQEYLDAARALEHTLALIKGKLYGEVHASHLAWPELWETAHAELDAHNQVERRMVDFLIAHDEPTAVDELAQRVFEAETRGPTRPHPRTPHTGLGGALARRMWALADRFWDTAEGRVIPDPVRPEPHRHDSLIGQYLVADPQFDADATLIEHHHKNARSHRRRGRSSR